MDPARTIKRTGCADLAKDRTAHDGCAGAGRRSYAANLNHSLARQQDLKTPRAPAPNIPITPTAIGTMRAPDSWAGKITEARVLYLVLAYCLVIGALLALSRRDPHLWDALLFRIPPWTP